jgi:hypothetical protein
MKKNRSSIKLSENVGKKKVGGLIPVIGVDGQASQ